MIIRKADGFGNIDNYSIPDSYIKNEDGKVIFTHTEDVRPIMESVHFLKENTDNGFTHDRSGQLIGRIPAVVWAQHAEEFNNDAGAIERWLNSEAGQPFKVAKNVKKPSLRYKRIMTI